MEYKDIIGNMNAIEALASQISAILDLLQCSDGADEESIHVSAEMAETMLDELMIEVEKIETTVKEKEHE